VSLRVLARAAPFASGAVAAAIWLRRRRPERPAPPVPADPVQPVPTDPVQPASERRPVDIVTVVDDLLASAR
jgi:hypothetical protein